jgi:hypothetical protein
MACYANTVVPVWIWGQDDVLVRADDIVLLALGDDGMRAECGSRRAVRLTGTPCSSAQMLALLEVMRRAGSDGRTVVIMPHGEAGSVAWRWECVDTLLDH